MLNSLAFDAPQAPPASPSSLRETAEWYERQQAASFPPRIVFDVRRLGGSVPFQGYPYEQIRPNPDLVAQLRTLQQHYVILDSSRLIIELLEEEPALFMLLVEAVRHLQIAFGERRLFHVRVQHHREPLDGFYRPEEYFPTSRYLDRCSFCINQDDIPEKNVQVAQMRDVYTGSKKNFGSSWATF